jgi:hypothetical protein
VAEFCDQPDNLEVEGHRSLCFRNADAIEAKGADTTICRLLARVNTILVASCIVEVIEADE